MAELLGSDEVTDVVGDDRLTAGRHRKLEQHVVLGVGKERTDVCLTQIAHVRAQEGVLVLQDQRDREGDLETTLADLRKKTKCHAPPGAQTRHHNVGVQRPLSGQAWYHL